VAVFNDLNIVIDPKNHGNLTDLESCFPTGDKEKGFRPNTLNYFKVQIRHKNGAWNDWCNCAAHKEAMPEPFFPKCKPDWTGCRAKNAGGADGKTVVEVALSSVYYPVVLCVFQTNHTHQFKDREGNSIKKTFATTDLVPILFNVCHIIFTNHENI
jgi:hypothetical protein